MRPEKFPIKKWISSEQRVVEKFANKTPLDGRTACTAYVPRRITRSRTLKKEMETERVKA